MIPFFYFYEFWFVGDEKNRNLNNLFQKLFCSPSKITISTRIILRNTSKRSRMFDQLIFTQNVQISIIFLSVKSIVIRIKKWYHVSLTSNISAQNRSKCTSSGCFENVRTSRFQNWPWFWKSSKIWVSNRAKQNTTNLWSRLYIEDVFRAQTFLLLKRQAVFPFMLVVKVSALKTSSIERTIYWGRF